MESEKALREAAVPAKALVFQDTESFVSYLRSLEDDDTPIKAKLSIRGREREVELKRHINPDGSRGGWVGAGVLLDNVSMASNAIVYGEMELKDCSIGANATIITMGRQKKSGSNDEKNYIEDSQIGSNVTLIANGSNSIISVQHSRIDSGAYLDAGRGKIIIFISHVGSNVRSIAEASTRLDRLTMLDIEQSEIGSNSTIVFDQTPPRLAILDRTIPANSEIRADPSNNGMPFGYGKRVTNGGYGVRIPQASEKTLARFAAEAERYADANALSANTKKQLLSFVGDKATAEKLERAILLANYVHNHIAYDLNGFEKIVKKFGDNVEDIPLQHFIAFKKHSLSGKNGTGVCFEYALVTCLVLERELSAGKLNAVPLFVGGTAMSSNSNALHAWVEVQIDGRTFVIDPTNSMPFLIAGERDKNHNFIRYMAVSGYDYTYDSQPVVKPKPAQPVKPVIARLIRG